MAHSATSRRILKALGISLAALGLLAVLTVLCLEIALRTDSIREGILARILPRVEEATGVRAATADLSISLLSGSLTVVDLELRAVTAEGIAEPFAKAALVRARWSPWSLVRAIASGHFELELLHVEQPMVDLGLPLPVARESDEEAAAELPLAIDRMTVREGEVVGPVPEEVGEYLRGWKVSSLSVDASLDGNEFGMREMSAVVRLDRAGKEATTFEFGAELDGRIDRPIEIRRFELTGDPLHLGASGRLGRDASDLLLRFGIEADPGFLGGAPLGRVASVNGEVDLARKKGSVSVLAQDLPGSLLEPFVEDSLARDLELGATRFSLEGEVTIEDDRIQGPIRLSAGKGDATLFEVLVEPTRLDISAGETTPFAAAISAALLPGLAGTRTVSGRVAGDARVPAEWLIDGGTLDIQAPDADRLLASAGRIWPGLLPRSTLAGLPGLGRVSIGGDFSGLVVDPEIDASLDWRPSPEARVAATVAGRPVKGVVEISTEGADVQLAPFVDGMEGRLEWTGGVRGKLSKLSGGVHLAARDLSTVAESGEVETLFEVLDVRVDGDGSRLAWAFDGSAPAVGSLEGRGSLIPSDEIRSFDGVVELVPDALPFDLLEATFDLVDGSLVVDAGAFRAGLEAVAVSADLPLDALARLPGAEVMATLPLERADGELDLSWSVPDREWVEILPETWRRRVTRLDLGSSGRIEIDSECLACSRASGQLTGFAAEIDGRAIAATGSPDLALADGVLRIGPVALTGEDLALSIDGFAELDRQWTFGSELGALVIDSGAQVAGSVGSDWLRALLGESQALEIVTPGTLVVEGRGELRGGDLEADLTLDAPDLEMSVVSLGGLELAAPYARLVVAGGEVQLESLSSRIGDGTLALEGRFRLDDPLADAGGQLLLNDPLPGLELLELPFEIDRGLLSVATGRLVNGGGEGSVRLTVPLSAAAADAVGQTASASWLAPPSDWAALLRLMSGSEDPDELMFGSSGEVTIDLRRPAASRARVIVDQAAISMRGRRTSLGEPLELTLADGLFTVPPATVRFGGETFTLTGRGELAREWEAGQPLANLVASFTVRGDGSLDSGLATPFLSGGRAVGPLEIDFEVSGTPAEFSGRILLDGPEASILYRTPYLARLSEPKAEIVMSEGAVRLESASARLNNGPLTVSGTLLEDDFTDLEIDFADALFRLDYGLLATIDGDLRIETDLTDGVGLLSGEIIVERGSLTRDVQLDFDLLTELLAPIDLSTTEDDPLALIELDLAVATSEGVRVKNNIGDMLVRWEPIAVSGSLARPILKGQVEVDPGGLLYAYGQTVRLDRAVVEYPGGELDEPRLDLEVTTSLEDPTIANLAGDDPFRSQSSATQTDATAAERAQANLALYYGDQVASRLGESVGAKISLRPLLIFGEAEPQARLTISQDFSTHFAVAASIDLTNAENRTYLIEAHDFRSFPGFVGQAFTDDDSAYGGALLQRLEFGGSRLSSQADLPKLTKIKLDKVPGISKRGLKRALGLTKGEPFAPENQFAAEVEVLDFLLTKGYPNASAKVTATRIGRNERKVRVDLAVEPGPYVEFEFVGEELSKPLRRLIRSHYRTDFFEPESIESMRAEAVRALRSEGFVSPKVDIRVDPLDPDTPDGDRRVVIETVGGARISPEAPVFLGVEPEVAEALGRAFFSAVQRVELAEGLPGADARLLRTLADLGYPQASIRNRYTSLNDRRLTVEVEPGPRRTVSSVSIVSDDEIDRERLQELLAVRAGDPLRRDRLSASALRLEQSLSDQGYLAARVRTVVDGGGETEAMSLPVEFRIERGDQHVVESVEFTGLRSTKEKWIERIAGVERGETLASGDLSSARTALWRTGLFSAVGTKTEDLGDGRQRVVFDLAERDRFRLAYGVRWDSEDGSSAVFDATDENFLGRSWTLGMRALWSDDDKSVRWLTRIPRAGGGRGSLEFFALINELIEFGIISEKLEATVQYSLPVGKSTTLRMYGRYSDTKLTEEEPDPFFPLNERIKRPVLGWQYLYDSRGAEIFRERGLFASVDLSGSEEFLGSDFRYARLFSQMNVYRGIGRLFGRSLSWAQSYRVGFARAFGQELLRDERFFAGGEYSVRGYDTESLGPQESLGSIVRPLGGESLLVINQELRWRVFTDYALVLFGDTGNVWADSGDFGSDLFSSLGVGVRAATPVGLIRFDAARPLDLRPEVDSEWVFYFGLGATF